MTARPPPVTGERLGLSAVDRALSTRIHDGLSVLPALALTRNGTFVNASVSKLSPFVTWNRPPYIVIVDKCAPFGNAAVDKCRWNIDAGDCPFCYAIPTRTQPPHYTIDSAQFRNSLLVNFAAKLKLCESNMSVHWLLDPSVFKSEHADLAAAIVQTRQSACRCLIAGKIRNPRTVGRFPKSPVS
jgi:hypothetical protein